MKKSFAFFFIIALSFSAQQVFAANSASDKGTTAVPFLKLAGGARSAALGNAYTAMSGDANSLMLNPAALVTAPSVLSLTHAAYLDASFFDVGALSLKVSDHAALGFGFEYFSAGSVMQTDVDANSLGDFHPYDSSYNLGYAYEFSPLSVGLAVKSIHSKLASSASSEAVDVGVLSRAFTQKDFRLGVAALNIGKSMKFETESAPLPSEMKIGAALEPLQSWTLSLDGGFPRDNQPYVAAGSEVRFDLGAHSTLATRLGFNSATLNDVSGFSGLNLGLGITLGRFGLDYAFVPLGTVGLTHRISLEVRW